MQLLGYVCPPKSIWTHLSFNMRREPWFKEPLHPGLHRLNFAGSKSLHRYLIVSLFLLFAWSQVASGPGLCRPKKASTNTSNKKLLEQATFFMLTKQYFVALPLFEQAVKREPGNSDAYNGMAWCLHCTGRSNEGMAAAEKAVKLNPKNPYSHQILGAIYFSRGMVDQARTEFRAALVLNPKKRCRGCADLTALLGKDIPPPPPPSEPKWPPAGWPDASKWASAQPAPGPKSKKRKPAVVAKKNVRAVKLEPSDSSDASAAVSAKPADASPKSVPASPRASQESPKLPQESPRTVQESNSTDKMHKRSSGL